MDNDPNDFAKKWERRRKLADEAFRENLKVVFSALRDLKVERVVMTYSGGGDSGEYHYPIYTMRDGRSLESRSGYGGSSYKYDSSEEFTTDAEVTIREVNYGDWNQETRVQGPAYIVKTVGPLCDAVYALMEDAVELEHCGWYNNEGGEGEVVIDLEEGLLQVDHGDYITETSWSTQTYRPGDV